MVQNYNIFSFYQRNFRFIFYDFHNALIIRIFKKDEWKGNQKLLRLSDLELLDITFPRGYSKFRIMDIWDNHVFISDESERIALCKMVV